MARGDNFRGKKPLGSGRKKGQVSQHTALTRSFIQGFLDRNSDEVQKLFDRVAKEEPATALRLFVDLCEFTLPKLARSDIRIAVHQDIADYTDEQLLTISQVEPHAITDQRVIDASLQEPAGGEGGSPSQAGARKKRARQKAPHPVRRVHKH